jgi:hypothetical protein
MKKLTSFFLVCSGADSEFLRQCRTETSKYAGMGATIFFTGVFAALAAGYALYTVFDNFWIAGFFGIVWGLMIFNLDRYIVSSMRKEGKFSREFTMALPRIILAIIISIVIAKPLELKIFEKEITPELVVMEQEAYSRQESELKLRYQPLLDSLQSERKALLDVVAEKARTRDALVKIAQEEADGTGGSKRRNLGPIYLAKKADADQAEKELLELRTQMNERIATIDALMREQETSRGKDMIALQRTPLNGPAARMEALSRLTQRSSAIWWANIFVLLLFIAIETAPIFVKLISSKGPYDNLLKIEEHSYYAREVEETARTNADTKARTSGLPQHERTIISDRLDSAL